jgi:ribonucleoside-triphosphate reductase
MVEPVSLQVIKRDGQRVPFDTDKIARAVGRCFDEEPIARTVLPLDIAVSVADDAASYQAGTGLDPTVEQIQDWVEDRLLAAGLKDDARRYMRYRDEHARQREARPVPPEVKAAFDASDQYFPTALQKFQFFDKYARYDTALGRRETWIETVDRTVSFLHELAQPYADLGAEFYARIRAGILEMRVMPSMRLLAMAGPAARRDNTALYNCSYQPVDGIESFREALVIAMAGCGVGYSVESQYVDRFPRVLTEREPVDMLPVHRVEDSASGWGDAVLVGAYTWMMGEDLIFDTSLVRPAGTPLRTKGGRASGPEPLMQMLKFIRAKIRSRAGKRLRPIDVHDIMCAIGGAVVSGGVRRTAMISLFDFDDEEMLHCKDGDFARENSQRWNANNSAVWTNVKELDQLQYVDRMMAMFRSGRGEPGIFNREAASSLRPERRQDGDFGTNPCGEINLLPREFCNLSSIVVRKGDTNAALFEKAQLAAQIGTIQSLATHFPYLRSDWRRNCESERLLGVSLDGQMDNQAVVKEAMDWIQREVVRSNRSLARTLGINQSAATTCVKPSGNSSQLLDASSGLHVRWSKYYIRRVRVAASSPLARVLKDAGAPMQAENGEDPITPVTWVVSFPVASPTGAVTRNDVSAIAQCEWWYQNKRFYTEHNPSVTITYRPHELVDIMKWVWDRRDKIGGMAFLPAFDAQYDQLPYEEIDQAEYERRVAAFPEIDFSKVYRYEASDLSTASSLGACDGPVCEVNA